MSSEVLFITAFHPGGSGVIGAGEAISEDTVRALLASGKRVHVLCLAYDDQKANPAVVALCASYRTLRQTKLETILGIVRGLSAGSSFAPWLFTRASARNVNVACAMLAEENASEVWLDFPSTLAFASHLQEKRVTYFVHDVVAQKIARRPLIGVLGRLVQSVERRLLSSVQRCIVLSQKDDDLLRQMAFQGDIAVRPPEHVRVGKVSEARPVAQILDDFAGRKNLVFFGSMRRPENHWSILHFILFSYPKIRRCHKDVQFWVLGLSPRLTLRLLGRFVPGLRVVGAVDDPVPAFRAAELCIVPLRLGAGVKIKVLQMLDAGAKVLASNVGGEGIASTPNLAVVPYDEIPQAACRLLSNPA